MSARFRNVSPLGRLHIPALDRIVKAGEVFTVTDDLLAEALARQTSNFEPTDEPADPYDPPAPAVAGPAVEWPTPKWWASAPGWCLVSLRCLACSKVAARFMVPAYREPSPRDPGGLVRGPRKAPRGAIVLTVADGLALGGWERLSVADWRTVGTRYAYESRNNRVEAPCRDAWQMFPGLDDPKLRAALLRALRGRRAPAAAWFTDHAMTDGRTIHHARLDDSPVPGALRCWPR